MATYNIDNLPDELLVGDVVECPYSGGEKTITLNHGKYKLECWGAIGGIYDTAKPNGGYSVGDYVISSQQTLYLNCGGAGTRASATGGYNGGGGTTAGSTRGNTGGGATHIATASGVLASLVNNKGSVIIVAGGGGGCGHGQSSQDYLGGLGGGTSGGDGTSSASKYYGHGGTQTEGGAGASGYAGAESGTFGQGAAAYPKDDEGRPGAGGGGWYGGGAGAGETTGTIFKQTYAGSGGGGSGYVNASLLTNASTNQESTSSNPDTAEYAGYIRITVLPYTQKTINVIYNGNLIAEGIVDEQASIIYDGRQIATIPPVGETVTIECAGDDGATAHILRTPINIAGIIIPDKTNGQKHKMTHNIIVRSREA